MTAPRDPAAELIAVNRRRRTARRWILIGSVPVLLLALVLVVKLLGMVGFAHRSIVTHFAADPAGTIAAAQWLQPMNWFEPYKAPYNLGVGLAAAGELPQARAAFEEALSLASGLEVCAIRVNLALVVEWMGDAADAEGDAAGANALWTEALQIVADTPPECDSDEANEQSPDPNRDLGDELDEQEQRLQDKIEQQQSGEGEGEGQGGGQGETEQGPSLSQLDDIEDRLQQGQQERDGLDGGGSGGAERPW